VQIQNTMQSQQVSNTPNPAIVQQQVTAQIENLRWQEKMQEAQLANTRQAQIESHYETMAREIASHVSALLGVAILAGGAIHLFRRFIAADLRKHEIETQADIQKNQDDNLADIEIAKATGKAPDHSEDE